MNGYLLDTDICSLHLRGSSVVSPQLVRQAKSLSISVVTVSEILTWTLRQNAAAKWHRQFLRFLDATQVLPVDIHVAERAGQIRAKSFDRGQPLAVADMLIAATALVYGLTLVTHNAKHFSNIDSLVIEDWSAP
ncbi:MAG: type II toxin-antitoxin system VapC family toxin [Planctomycetaceae bacterium]|nr:type II toxin-antitoxin system VapC family toxin [Planctomycetaceae bacterium]